MSLQERIGQTDTRAMRSLRRNFVSKIPYLNVTFSKTLRKHGLRIHVRKMKTHKFRAQFYQKQSYLLTNEM